MDLKNVAEFSGHAGKLGVLTNKESRLPPLLDLAGRQGLLGNKPLQAGQASDCLQAAIAQRILPPHADVHQLQGLLQAGKKLGIRDGQDTLTNVLECAKAQSLLPKQEGMADTAADGRAIVRHRLRFEPFLFSELLEVEIVERINQHAMLRIKGILDPAKASTHSADAPPDDDVVQKTDAQQAATLYYLDENDALQVLFHGNIAELEQMQTTDVKWLEAKVIGLSGTLDIKKNSRSFQRLTETYDDISRRVMQGQAELKSCQPTRSIEKLIVQYRETDWEFLCRMAARFNTGLVPAVDEKTCRIYFGVPLGETAKSLNAAAYRIEKNLRRYQQTDANEVTNSQPKLSDADFIAYRVESVERFRIGDCVSFNERTLYVKSLRAELRQSVLTYEYELSGRGGLVQNDRFNPELAGVSLMGSVKEITKDQVKVHISEIDAQWDESGDWYFPYSTVFSSPDGSGWYCMPEPGDTVRVHFMNHRDEDAVASSSINRDQSLKKQRDNSSGAEEDTMPRSNPDHKSLSNVQGKEVLFTPEGIFITNQAGKMFVNLTDSEGITLVSEKDINIQAKESVYLKADKEIALVAGEKLTLNGSAANISMEKNSVISIKGSLVRTN